MLIKIFIINIFIKYINYQDMYENIKLCNVYTNTKLHNIFVKYLHIFSNKSPIYIFAYGI